MAKPRKTLQKEWSVFTDTSLFEDVACWLNSPEAEQQLELSDLVCNLLKDVEVDAPQRVLIWADTERLSIEQSIRRIRAQHPRFPRQLVEDALISWLEMEYAPEHYSDAQFEELDRLTERWVRDYQRQPKKPEK
jgi:hypothetical protein